MFEVSHKTLMVGLNTSSTVHFSPKAHLHTHVRRVAIRRSGVRFAKKRVSTIPDKQAGRAGRSGRLIDIQTRTRCVGRRPKVLNRLFRDTDTD